jgi:hypothetical protein
VTLSLDAAATAVITSDARGAHWLLEFDFASGTARYTTYPLSLVVNGNTYTGLGHVLDVSDVSETEEPGGDELTLAMTLTATTSLLSALVGSAEDYRGRAIRLYLQLTDATGQPVGAPVHRWTGRMEPARVKWTPSKPDQGPQAHIEMPCVRGGASRRRRHDGLRLSHTQQQARFPGDMGLEYLHDLAEKPVVWLSKRFQEI